eukprot:Nk52_evm18s157 gene=Nk52_evmTU18s157
MFRLQVHTKKGIRREMWNNGEHFIFREEGERTHIETKCYNSKTYQVQKEHITGINNGKDFMNAVAQTLPKAPTLRGCCKVCYRQVKCDDPNCPKQKEGKCSHDLSSQTNQFCDKCGVFLHNHDRMVLVERTLPTGETSYRIEVINCWKRFHSNQLLPTLPKRTVPRGMLETYEKSIIKNGRIEGPPAEDSESEDENTPENRRKKGRRSFKGT